MSEEINENCYPPRDDRYPPRDDRYPPRDDRYDDITLDLMRRLAGREQNQIELYTFLINRASNMQTQQMETVRTDRRILRTLRNIEEENLEIINRLYRDITGDDIIAIRDEFMTPSSYRRGLETALFSEIEDIRLYRELWSGLSRPAYRDRVFGIILDELTKLDRINFIYSRAF